MPSKVKWSVAERRARLAIRHHLSPAWHAGTPRELASDLVALHATDPATVFLSIAARTTRPSVARIEHALYEEKSLVRMLGMRRTMFVVLDDFAPTIQAACTDAIAARLKRQYQQMLASKNFVDDVPRWWDAVAERTVAELEKLGEATAQELGKHVPELKTQIHVAEGKSYAATQSIATWMLMQLSAEGRIVRGQPRGSWISSQYRWRRLERTARVPLAEAQGALVREWLRAFGPGTLQDLKWWSGLTLGEVKRALAGLEVVEVELGEGTGLILADDADPPPAPEAWVALLPALDVTPMAYAQREWFLGPHAAALFDRSGNIGPTLWCDGRIVGGWAQRPNGTIASKLLEDVGAEAEQRLAAQAHTLEAWLGGVRVTPRFRTPLERELSA